MKLNEEYFYCFGCGATGDVIDLTARLYNLSPKKPPRSWRRILALSMTVRLLPRRNYVRQKTEAQKFQENRDHAFRVLADYFHLLKSGKPTTPKTPEETHHPRFLEAVQQRIISAICWILFLEDSPEEQKAMDR